MLGIGLIIAVIIGAYLMTAYVRLFSMRNRVRESFATHEHETLALVHRMRAGLRDHHFPKWI